MHNRKWLIATLGVSIAASSAAAAETPTSSSASRPNIIFILSDDVSIGNIGCYGADNYKTPNIDALARGGIRHTLCFSTPLCGPSRAEILTGRYPFRTGMISNQSGGVMKPANEIMIPKILKAAGYVTAQVGKWSQLPLQPGDWGFDEYLRFPGSGRYWAHQGPNYTQNGQEKQLSPDKYLPDVMHEFLVDFITRHKDQPFYIHYAMSHVHGPILRTPDSVPGKKDLYADNISYMDKLVGKLVAELDRLKLREKTLLVFVGDNGTAVFESGRATIGGRRMSGAKGTLWEGGSRVPMISNWPGTTPAGKTSDALMDFSDYLPTFAELAGAKLPDGVKIDGHSFAGEVLGKPPKPRDWVYVELNGHWYARSTKWKLIKTGDLFDMKDAPFVEAPVQRNTTDTQAVAARKQLQSVLDGLNPAAGKQGALSMKTERKAAMREPGNQALQTSVTQIRQQIKALPPGPEKRKLRRTLRQEMGLPPGGRAGTATP